ncbi:zinc dependent phospholipase C family protein [Oscillospiraceae bacterium HV4-5-C5C]|nr:zinc dependent phospholipase C family protein [Oscillospiraceae bacterium HV4-5-C5C]
MNFQTHVFMGKVIVKAVNQRIAFPIKEKAFLAGHVLADYSPLMFLHPHLAVCSMDYVQYKISMLSGIDLDIESLLGSDLPAFQMGVLAHYICDFFCYAHSGADFGNVREHLQYEDFLDNYRRTWAEQLRDIDWGGQFEPLTSVEDIQGYLEKAVAAYNKGGQSVEKDLTLAMENSVRILLSVSRIRLTQKQAVLAWQA